MAIQRIQGGTPTEIDHILLWTRSSGFMYSNGWFGTIPVNGWLSQNVDFSYTSTLTFNYKGKSGGISVQVLIDDAVIKTETVASGGSSTSASVDVSSYTGVHTLKFVILTNTGEIGYISLMATPPPTANFTFAFPNPQTNPLSVQFTDSSSQTPTSWLWEFGDGTTSTAQSPSHTYTENKPYQVKLTAANANGSNEITKTVTPPKPPVSNFSATAKEGLTVEFKDLSINTPTGWLWDFGETEDKTLKNPKHTYQNPGNYTVKLTATNADGSNQASKSVQVAVTAPAKPAADFSSSVPNAGSPLALQFTDQSTGSPTSWLWDFGDGTTSTDQNPTHTYAGAGLFTVKLTAANVNGSATVSKSMNVQTGPVTPPASGAASPGTVPANKTARITLTGTGFKTGAKVRIIKPALWGVGKIVSFSPSQIVFDFFFGAEFSGACGVAVISTTGKTIMFENAITVS